MENNFTIYIHHNLINHKIYVGITCQDPKTRWKRGCGYEHNPHLTNAFKYFGWNNFEHIIVGTCLSKESACEIEKELIALYRSNEYAFGYNSSSGGELSAYKHGRSGTKEYQKEIQNSHEYLEKNHLRSQIYNRIQIYFNLGMVISTEFTPEIWDNVDKMKDFLQKYPIIKRCKKCNCIFELTKDQSNKKTYCPTCTEHQKERDKEVKRKYKLWENKRDKTQRFVTNEQIDKDASMLLLWINPARQSY